MKKKRKTKNNIKVKQKQKGPKEVVSVWTSSCHSHRSAVTVWLCESVFSLTVLLCLCVWFCVSSCTPVLHQPPLSCPVSSSSFFQVPWLILFTVFPSPLRLLHSLVSLFYSSVQFFVFVCLSPCFCLKIFNKCSIFDPGFCPLLLCPNTRKTHFMTATKSSGDRKHLETSQSTFKAWWNLLNSGCQSANVLCDCFSVLQFAVITLYCCYYWPGLPCKKRYVVSVGLTWLNKKKGKKKKVSNLIRIRHH